MQKKEKSENVKEIRNQSQSESRRGMSKYHCTPNQTEAIHKLRPNSSP